MKKGLSFVSLLVFCFSKNNTNFNSLFDIIWGILRVLKKPLLGLEDIDLHRKIKTLPGVSNLIFKILVFMYHLFQKWNLDNEARFTKTPPHWSKTNPYDLRPHILDI